MQSACKRFRQYRIRGKCESFPLLLVSLHSVQSISYFNLSLRLAAVGEATLSPPCWRTWDMSLISVPHFFIHKLDLLACLPSRLKIL